MKAVPMLVLAVCGAAAGCTSVDLSTFPNSNASYAEVNAEVGCKSTYSDAKKEDIFNTRYKNRWMTWTGEVVLADADDVSLNLDAVFVQDLKVSFAEKQAGYNLTKGTPVTVNFLMKSAGGCIVAFGGDYASIVPPGSRAPTVHTGVTWQINTPLVIVVLGYAVWSLRKEKGKP